MRTAIFCVLALSAGCSKEKAADTPAGAAGPPAAAKPDRDDGEWAAQLELAHETEAAFLKLVKARGDAAKIEDAEKKLWAIEDEHFQILKRHPEWPKKPLKH